MRHAKKILGLLLALMLVLAMAAPAFAAGETTGTITIKDSQTVKVAGKTFKAYKLMDVKAYKDAEHVVYTVPNELRSFYNTRYGVKDDATDYDAQVAKKIAADPDLADFAAKALKAAKDAGMTPVSVTAGADATSVDIANLPHGYYVIEDASTEAPISALMLDTTNTNPQITIKADVPDVTKKIDAATDTDPNNGETPVTSNNASVGDKVPYILTSKVPDMTGYTKYYFYITDTLSKGLTYNEDPGVAITITKKDGTEKKLVKDTDFTVSCTKKENEDNTLEIVFKNFIQYNTAEYKDAAITITYSATINKNAVIGVAGNPNTVKLNYSNNPNETVDHVDGNPDKPKDPVGESEDKKTYTYATSVKLIKVDQDQQPLTGAEFEITGTRMNTVLVTGETYEKVAAGETGEYWKLKDGTYTTTAPVTSSDPNKDTSAHYESTTDKYKKVTYTKTEVTPAGDVKCTAFVDENGGLLFEGLAEGEYTIKELKAPNGYNKLDKDIKLTIGWTAPVAPSTDCTWTYTWKEDGNDEVKGNTYDYKVVNVSGSLLPSTGGIGTTIFYAVGSILLVGAAVLLIAKRRMNAEK